MQVLNRFMLPPAMDLLDDLLERLILKSSHALILGRDAIEAALGHFFSYSCAVLPLVLPSCACLYLDSHDT